MRADRSPVRSPSLLLLALAAAQVLTQVAVHRGVEAGVAAAPAARLRAADLRVADLRLDLGDLEGPAVVAVVVGVCATFRCH